MIKRVIKPTDKIIEYIGNDYAKCLYLYLDYIKYGVDNPNIKIWIQEKENEIVGLLLMYYSGMHIFSKKQNCDSKEIEELIRKENPSIICAEKNIIISLEKKFKNYKSEYGWVRKLESIDKKYNDLDVVSAGDDDFYSIAELLYNDEDIGSSYTLEGLYQQLVTRNKEKYGRNYIIKDDKAILSHAGTGAEDKNIGVLNYVITNPDYRGKGYATKVVGKLCYDLIKGGKKVYLINYTEESTKLYDKLGFEICCEIGKLY